METEAKTNEQDTQDTQEQPKRSVTLAPVAKIIFKQGDDVTVETVNRDLFSVMDTLGKKLAIFQGEEDVRGCTVSVHSVEDPKLSDPLPEGEEPWEGEYFVGGLTIEDMSIPEAMRAIIVAVFPPEAALKHLERLAEQLFLRSTLDGFVFVGSFDGVPAVLPLLSSFKPQTPEGFKLLHSQLLKQASALRTWAEDKFPDIAAKVDWDDEPGNKPSGLVLPSGLPVESRGTIL